MVSLQQSIAFLVDNDDLFDYDYRYNDTPMNPSPFKQHVLTFCCLFRRLFYLVSGLVIRPIEDGSQSSKVTIICQVKGSVPSKVKNTFLAAKPAKWIAELKKHHAKMSQEVQVKEE